MIKTQFQLSDFVILKTNLNTLMNYKNVIKDFFGKKSIFRDQGKNLIVLLGSFADFDSFEYAQHLSNQSNKLNEQSINLILIGIGSEKSKEFFCKFNKIDPQHVFAVRNADLHKELNLDPGLVLPMPAMINLLVMCAGIGSKGTIKEVLRGYWGDSKANSLFAPDEDVNIGTFSLFKGKMFNIFSEKQQLRPFELATRRLINMVEILTNWNIYVPDSKFLTQRGATILLNEKDEVLYEYISKSLLGYSSKMSKPLSFLDNFLN